MSGSSNRHLFGMTLGGILLATVLTAANAAAATTAPARSLLVICNIVGGVEFHELPIVQKLQQDGWAVKGADISQINDALLAQFQVVVVTDVSRLNATAQKPNSCDAQRPILEQWGKLLNTYVTRGGNLWIFGRSTHHMGSPDAVNGLNVVLQPWGAQVLHEMVRDPKHETFQSQHMRFRYFYTNEITRDPLTQGVKGIWSPNHIMVGITSPLELGPDWKPLIRAASSAISHPVVSDNGYPKEEDKPGTSKRGAIAAVRTLGQGHILLTGWGATIPFFGFNHIVWDDIQPTAGLDGKRSDWLTFFTRSLQVLADGAQSVGGFHEAPPVRQDPQPQVVTDWSAVKLGMPGQILFRGLIGASTALSDGQGSVADFAQVARELKLDFVVFTEDLQKISADGFKQLVAQCQAASTDDFAAVPGLKYREVNENQKIIVGPNCWPRPSKLHLPDRKIYDPVFLWFDSGVPLHLYYNTGRNAYPPYAYRGYNALAVLTYDEGQLTDEAVPAFLDNNHHGDMLTPLVVNLSRSPAALRRASCWYYAPANKLTDWVHEAGQEYSRYMGWSQGFISSGPRILQWTGHNLTRQSAGRWYVPGTERWRVVLQAEADVPLQTVEILENQQVIRTYRPQGKTFDLTLDEVHDRQKVLVARVTDTAGHWALSGGLTIADMQFRQFLCSDRQNFMGGQQQTRDAKDREILLQATAMLDKCSRAGFGNVQTSDSRTLNPYGVDGGFGNTFMLNTPVMVRGKTWDEFRSAVFHNGFRYCSRDAILFDLQITHRYANDASVWPNLENPWQGYDPQRYFAASVTAYNFPKQVNGISPTLVEFQVKFDRAVELSTVCDPDQGRWIFWTHRLGFHHPEFRFNMLKGLPGWETPPSKTYTDNFPPLVLATNEGEATPGVEDNCVIIAPDGKTTALKAGPDAAHPNSWQNTLAPGTAVALSPNPGGSGGFFLLDGKLDARIELGYDWKRIYAGLYQPQKFAAGDEYNTRLLLFQNRFRETNLLEDWNSFRDRFGVAGKPPAYSLKLTQGNVLGTKYLLDLKADKGAVRLVVGQADLGQRLPIRIAGLNEQCTAASVNNTRKEWLPIGVTALEAYATLDTRPGPSELFIGNLVACSEPTLWCTVLPEGQGFVIDVHNPTAQSVKATITVPDGLWMLAAGSKPADVPAGSTVRVAW